MVDVCELTKFAASGRAVRLVMDIGAALGISRSAIQKHVEHLKDAQRLRRIGPDARREIGVGDCVVVTWNREGESDGIRIAPAWKLLLEDDQ